MDEQQTTAPRTARASETDVWARIAAPLPDGAISWRQDGKVTNNGGRFAARFVAYIDANTVRERLDSAVPGMWDLALTLLPAMPGSANDDGEPLAFFKSRLTILGVSREDVGSGRDYKAAATDAFKRAAVRFGIGHELYAFGQNWVAMDGDGRYAKPVEDPQAAYERRNSGASRPNVPPPAPMTRHELPPDAVPVTRSSDAAPAAPAAPAAMDPECPKCGGKMWDNRLTKRNPKAPDFKCRDKNGCDGVVWPGQAEKAKAKAAAAGPLVDVDGGDGLSALDDEEDDLPF